jgi:hypothetical protein
MVEVSNELIYKLMLEIQAELKDVRAEQQVTSAKIGTMAASMVSMSKQIEDLTTSTRLIAVAVDDHSHRLDRIEKKLDLTHA